MRTKMVELNLSIPEDIWTMMQQMMKDTGAPNGAGLVADALYLYQIILVARNRGAEVLLARGGRLESIRLPEEFRAAKKQREGR